MEALLADEGFTWSPEACSPLGRGVTCADPARQLGLSLAAHFGLIYIKDRASMLPPLALDPPPGAGVLDLCASPGSKTGLLAQMVGPEGFVLANEPNPDRLNVLRANLQRMNLMHVATCNHPGERMPLPEASFDHILLDPPCSGWGAEAKHKNVRKQWQGQRVDQLIALQRKLLAEAARILAPGGRLVYSTCTTNPEENQAQAAWACETLGLDPVALSPAPGFTYNKTVDGALSVDMSGGEAQGFFIAALAKPGEPHGGLEDRMALQVPRGAEELPLDSLPKLGAAWDRLPPGSVYKVGDKIMFFHDKAMRLPPGLRWRGFVLGKAGKGGGFKLAPRARKLLQDYEVYGGLDINDAATLRALVQGQSLGLTHPKNFLGGEGLYYKGLPLGWLTIKGVRALWSDR